MKEIIGTKKFNTTLDKICSQFVTNSKSELKKRNVGIVGIQTRGVTLARRIAKNLEKEYRFSVPVGSLDITLYRDDIGEIGNQPLVKETEIHLNIEGKIILLVDDVLYTGRTIRAALDALLELGRPQLVRLAVVIDRSGRELPIQPDYFGMRVDIGPQEEVQLMVKENDGKDGVWIVQRSKKHFSPSR